MSGPRLKTLVFCTAYTHGSAGWFYSWDQRYRTWVDAIRNSTLEYDQILLVDDGSASLPDWPDVAVLSSSHSDIRTDAALVLYHFEDHLGRRATSDFPGWVRSFFFAARFARENGFEKIVHLEADAFLISQRVQHYVNGLRAGWVSFYCPRFRRPESGIQIMAGSGLERYFEFARRPIESLAGTVIETALPFTHVEDAFIGDRYGEYLDTIPLQADWCMQAIPNDRLPPEAFFWWLPAKVQSSATSATWRPKVNAASAFAHSGLWYTDFFLRLDAVMKPRRYLEIGTNAGHSLRCFSCDAIGVDPNFVLQPDVVGRRKRLFLYQGPSDEFFASDDLARVFPQGFDIAFLDGLHHAEVLLRDFINAEKHSRPDSLIFMHDCIPLNERMAERERRREETEDPAIRDFWTGDVWKLMIAFNEYRPDLKIVYLDCAPSGLAVCMNPNRVSTILAERYDEILARFAELTLAEVGLEALWSLYPAMDSRELAAHPRNIKQAFGSRWLPTFSTKMIDNNFGGVSAPILVHYGA